MTPIRSQPRLTEADRRTEAVLTYIARMDRYAHPAGCCDAAGVWYPAGAERRPCCSEAGRPSPHWPWTLMRHCRTAVHVAHLFDVDRAEVAAALDATELKVVCALATSSADPAFALIDEALAAARGEPTENERIEQMAPDELRVPSARHLDGLTGPERLAEACHVLLTRRAHIDHPAGARDTDGRWHPADDERRPCCSVAEQLTGASRWSLVRHCRTVAHVANLYDVSALEVWAEAQCEFGQGEQEEDGWLARRPLGYPHLTRKDPT